MAVKCYINKVEYPLVGAVEITDHAAATSESSIVVDIQGLPEPKALDAVYLFEGDYLLFGGICSIPQSPTWESPYTPQHYELTIGGMNNLLTRRYINKAWSSANIYEIVMEIYARIIGAENIALGTVSNTLASLPAQPYIAPDMTAYDVLTELAELVGAVWNIEPNHASTLRDYLGTAREPLVFYAGQAGPAPAVTPFGFYDTPSFKPFRFTFLLREDFPRYTPSQPLEGITKTVDSYDLRTVQIVKGGSGISDPQTESFVFSADQKEIEVSWPVVELPIITVDGSLATVGVKGISSDDATKQFLFSYNSELIEINPDYSPALSQGSSISITYRGFFELRARLENRQMIEQAKNKAGTSGLIESIEDNDRYTTAAELYRYTANKLYQKAQAEEQITLTTPSSQGTEPFTIWALSLPAQRIQGEYVVVEKVTTISPNHQSVQLTLKDKGYLTAYGTIFYQKYKNSPTGIREADIVIDSSTIENTLAISCNLRVRAPLCCFADDGQPWLWKGYYAQY